MAIYILIKKKGSKRYSGVFKARTGVSATKLRKQLKKDLSKNLTFRLASFAMVKRVILSQRPKSRVKRKSPVKRKRRVVKRRRKVIKRRRRRR